MDPALKARLTSRDLWLRLLYMILLAIAYSLAELVMTVVVIIQFLFILLTGGANEALLRLGQNLTCYIADIIRFQTFNSEEKPFPFADWPDQAPGGERWRERAEAGDVGVTSAPDADLTSEPDAGIAEPHVEPPSDPEVPQR